MHNSRFNTIHVVAHIFVSHKELWSLGAHSHILITGAGVGGGVRVIFWGLKFWPNDFLGSTKNAEIFVSREKNRGIFLKGKKD